MQIISLPLPSFLKNACPAYAKDRSIASLDDNKHKQRSQKTRLSLLITIIDLLKIDRLSLILLQATTANMSKWFRSEPMEYISLIVNEDAAHDCLADLGKLGVLQFTDVSRQVVCSLVVCASSSRHLNPCFATGAVVSLQTEQHTVVIIHSALTESIYSYTSLLIHTIVEPRLDSLSASLCFLCEALRRIGAQASILLQ